MPGYLRLMSSSRHNKHSSRFVLLKRERLEKRNYSTREIAKQDIFNYIEIFYRSVRRHTSITLWTSREFDRRLLMGGYNLQHH
jgi:putative transposase